MGRPAATRHAGRCLVGRCGLRDCAGSRPAIWGQRPQHGPRNGCYRHWGRGVEARLHVPTRLHLGCQRSLAGLQTPSIELQRRYGLVGRLLVQPAVHPSRLQRLGEQLGTGLQWLLQRRLQQRGMDFSKRELHRLRLLVGDDGSRRLHVPLAQLGQWRVADRGHFDAWL